MASRGWTLSMIQALIVIMPIMCHFELIPTTGLLKATFWTPIDSVLLHGDPFRLTFFLSCLTIVWIPVILICEYSQSPEPVAANEASQVDKDKELKKELKIREGTKKLQTYQAALEKNKWYSAAYDAQRELLNQRAAELRDKERIIQNQATEVARFDHRAEAAKLSLKNKSDYADGLVKQLEINAITIEDRDTTIREQAQHIMNSEWDLNAMANQMDEKDQRIWEITGQNSAAQEEIAKLRAAVKNEFTESDYCAALHTIDRREQDIVELQAQLKQYRDAHEFDRKTYESLLGTVGEHSEMPDAEFASIVKAWVQTAISKRSKPDHESKDTTAYRSECEAHRHSIELQHSLLQKSRKACDELEKEVASLKVQITDLQDSKDSDAARISAKLTGERQHILHELNMAQANLDDLTNSYKFIEQDRAALKLQLKDAHDLLKTHEGARDISNAERDRLESQLAQVVEQGLKVTRAYAKCENTLTQSKQDLFQARVQMQTVEHALELTGITCDIWNVKEASVLATELETLKPSPSPSEQEAQLAASCAQLSASNEQKQLEIREQRSQIRDFKKQLADKRAEIHSQHQTHYRANCKLTHALAASEREFANLQSRFSDLEARSGSRDKEAMALRVSCAEEQEQRTKLAAELSDLGKRHDDARGCLARCLRSNVRLRKSVGEKEERVAGLYKRVAELEGLVERSQCAGQNCREQMEVLMKLVGERQEQIAELEKRLELEGGEFVEVERGDLEGMAEVLDEVVEEEEEELVVVQHDETIQVDDDEDEVEFIIEDLEVDEDGDRFEAENGKEAC